MKIVRKVNGGKIVRRPRNDVNKTVHIAVDYPCNHCGMVETYCETEVFGSDEWTDDPSKSNCKKCKRIFNEYGELD